MAKVTFNKIITEQSIPKLGYHDDLSKYITYGDYDGTFTDIEVIYNSQQLFVSGTYEIEESRVYIEDMTIDPDEELGEKVYNKIKDLVQGLVEDFLEKNKEGFYD